MRTPRALIIALMVHPGLRKLRVWPSLLGRWVRRLAGRIAQQGGKAAALLRGGAGAGAGGYPLPLLPAGGSSSEGGQGQEKGGTAQEQQQQQASSGTDQQGHHQYAYVECRLYRTDRARNASYTCPAVLTVLPSPPKSSGGRFGGGGGRAVLRAGLARAWRRVRSDLSYLTYGVATPYKWAPILAGLLSPHMFLLACLPAMRAVGLLSNFWLQLGAYHILCEYVTSYLYMPR